MVFNPIIDDGRNLKPIDIANVLISAVFLPLNILISAYFFSRSWILLNILLCLLSTTDSFTSVVFLLYRFPSYHNQLTPQLSFNHYRIYSFVVRNHQYVRFTICRYFASVLSYYKTLDMSRDSVACYSADSASNSGYTCTFLG